MSDNLYSWLRRHFPADLDRTAIETPPGRVISYRKLDKLAAKFASALVELGLQPGDRVAVQVDKSPDAVALYLGTVRAGGVFLPLNTGYTTAELGYFLEDAGPRVVVCRPGAEREMKRCVAGAGGGQLVTLGDSEDGSLMDLLATADSSFEDVPRDPDDLAAILYTSGTTGRSKGAMLTIANLASNAEVLKDYWRFTDTDRLLHALPIFHTHGLFVACNTLLLAGGTMLFLKQFEIEQVLATLPRATSMMGVPTFYTRLLADRRFDRELVGHIRLFISGSAPLLAATHEEFRDRTGHVILERYGMTETGMLTSNPYDGERRAGTVGFPLPGVSLRVTHAEHGAVVPQGEAGILEVKGPNVFAGYWQMPEKTKAEFRDDGFFITGDIGVIDADGYVHIVGRAKDLIITGGYNVYPKEVETEIDALPMVVESAVIGVPHPDFGEGVTAVVVPRTAEVAPDEDVMIALLQERLARFKLPKRICFVDGLPRNSMGKVQKNVLRERYRNLYHPKM